MISVVFCLTLDFKKESNILDMKPDQPVHDLKPYVLCSSVLFYYNMQKLAANLIKLLSFIVLFNNIIEEI